MTKTENNIKRINCPKCKKIILDGKTAIVRILTFITVDKVSAKCRKCKTEITFSVAELF